MNSLKKITTLILTIGFLQSCNSQTENKEKQMDESITEITSQLKQYKEQPSHHAEVNSSACSFQLLINDMPAVSHYNQGGLSVSMPINPLILKSGKQTYTLRLYPGYYKEDKELKQVKALAKETKLNFSISVKHWNDANKKSQEIFVFTLPSKENKDGFKEFDFAGQTYYEFKGVFDATVPYELKGWSDGEKFDTKKLSDLEEEVLSAYTKLGNDMTKKDVEAEYKFAKTRTTEMAVAMYLDKNAIEASYQNDTEEYNSKDFTIQPFENYKMVIYGDGKVVALERTDSKYKGQSALRAKFVNDEGKKRVNFYNLLLYRPVKNGPLVPIR